jgi:hypothetical protein
MTAMVTGTDVATVLGLTYASDTAGFTAVAAAADAVMVSLLTDVDHSAHAQCKEAALSVAAEMYQARSSAGGEQVSVDFSPGPYRLSVWLTRRVAALTAAHFRVTGMVG